MIKTLPQQLEDWWKNQDFQAIERTLSGLPLEKFSPRMWELYVGAFLLLAEKEADSTPRYLRALNCLYYMLEEQMEKFEQFYYAYALALAHLDREAEALQVLNIYFTETPPELQLEAAEDLERMCLQRISQPHFRLGHFADRCQQLCASLQRMADRVEQLAESIATQSDHRVRAAHRQVGRWRQELQQLLTDATRPLSHQLLLQAEWADQRVVLSIQMEGIALNLHLLDVLLRQLRAHLPKSWHITLTDWEDYVAASHPEEKMGHSLSDLLQAEERYSTTIPPESASFEAHLHLEEAWTTEGTLALEYLRDQSFMFNLLRLSGCFCGFVAYSTEALSLNGSTMAEAVRAFNYQLAQFVQDALGDDLSVCFVGGGFGAGAFDHHPRTAYCDLIALDSSRVFSAIARFFSMRPQTYAQVQAFDRDALPFVLQADVAS